VPITQPLSAALRTAELLERVVMQIREGNVEYAWWALDTPEAARKTQARALEPPPASRRRPHEASRVSEHRRRVADWFARKARDFEERT
jgi:hypothetical protein